MRFKWPRLRVRALLARLAVEAPPIHPKVIEEQIKSRVGIMNSLAIGLFTATIVGPLINKTFMRSGWIGLPSAILCGVLLVAGQHYLRYIPDPAKPKEADNA